MMPEQKKKTVVEDLIKLISTEVTKIPDNRPNKCQDKISLHDVVMSALAAMHLKYPSLLQYDQARNTKWLGNNLKTLYNVNKPPSDTHMRTLLDTIDTKHLRPLFTTVFKKIQRSGYLKNYCFLKEGYLAPVDGTGHFASSKISCPECCVKNPETEKTQYYHQLLGISIVKPGRKEVIPLMPEPITRQINASKNNCEKKAFKRLLADTSREHPHLKLVITADDLYSDGPTINLIKTYKYSYILVAKDSSHVYLTAKVDELDAKNKVSRYEYTSSDGYQHWFRFANDVPINKSHSSLMVNYLEYVEISPKGKKYKNSWVTDIKLSEKNVTDITQGGRAKWKIENETFNTLKTQGYNLDHNYGHGNQYLASNMAGLTFLAFLVDQVAQMGCRLFQIALEVCHSKIALWRWIKNIFDCFKSLSWSELYEALIGLQKPARLRSLNPDTS